MRTERGAVFLDRDGVLNPVTVAINPPHAFAPRVKGELSLFPEVRGVIEKLKQRGDGIFIISNQPDVALANISHETKTALEIRFTELLKENGITVDGIYYCNHHPKAIDPGLRECECRKPMPGMLLTAAREHQINLENSWFVGDTDRDVNAGFRAGCRTILIERLWSNRQNCKPDFVVQTLEEAIDIILRSDTL